MARKYKLLVLTNPVAGGEKEFNEWYDTVHLADVLKVPGFVAARRFRMAAEMSPAPYSYCAIYDVETDDPKAAVAALAARAGTDQMPVSDKMDQRFYATLYEDFGESLVRES